MMVKVSTGVSPLSQRSHNPAKEKGAPSPMPMK